MRKLMLLLLLYWQYCVGHQNRKEPNKQLQLRTSAAGSSVVSTLQHGIGREQTSLQQSWQRYNEGKMKRKKLRQKQYQQQKKIARLNEQYATMVPIFHDGNHSITAEKGEDRFKDISLPHPHQRLSRRLMTRSAIVVQPSELSGNAPCSFLGAVCGMEAIEHQLVKTFFLPNDSILELGARFGTTSCAISSVLRNSGQLLSVEPDPSVWNLLDENRRSHHCNFWLLRGVISDRPAVAAVGAGYATRVHDKGMNSKRPDTDSTTSFEYYSLKAIQQTLNISFTAILIDCEGCIGSLFRDGNQSQRMPSLPVIAEQLRHIRTVILEGDMAIGARDCLSNCVDYNRWEKIFNSIGLHTIHKEKDQIYPSIIHYVFQRNKSERVGT